MNAELLQRKQYAKGGVGRWYWDYRDRKVLSFITKEEDILDLGCGEGVTLEKILRRFPGRNVLGIDGSRDRISVCRDHGLPAREGNAYSLDLEDQSWDCCLFLEVIEHMGEPHRALLEIRRILRKGGLLLLMFPHDWLFKAARLCFLKFREAYAPSGHLRQYDPEAMEKNLEAAGFRVDEKICIPFGLWACSLHCLVLARRK